MYEYMHIYSISLCWVLNFKLCTVYPHTLKCVLPWQLQKYSGNPDDP